MPTSADDVARHAARSIAVGSKSFAAAARLFDAETRQSVVMLYAWCRHCDDVTDGQEGGFAAALGPVGNAAQRLADLRRDTARALGNETAGLHPSFAALGHVARRHAIPPALFDAHLDGFALDVGGARFDTLPDLFGYCWHVAGVVGVMMAVIMGVRDEDTLDRACDLGLAFQLTNIARDVVEDARAGRTYVPLGWLREAGLEPGDLGDPQAALAIAHLRARLVAEAEPFYASALAGIRRLPRRSAWAVATAHGVYRMIGLKLVAAGEDAFGRRVSTSGAEKLGHVVRGGSAALWRPSRQAASRDGLWTRPRV